MVIVAKLIILLCMLFGCFCMIGMMKMGEDDFMVWLGGKLVTAWRWICGGKYGNE